jgi:hypothetical protein
MLARYERTCVPRIHEPLIKRTARLLGSFAGFSSVRERGIHSMQPQVSSTTATQNTKHENARKQSKPIICVSLLTQYQQVCLRRKTKDEPFTLVASSQAQLYEAPHTQFLWIQLHGTYSLVLNTRWNNPCNPTARNSETLSTQRKEPRVLVLDNRFAWIEGTQARCANQRQEGK